ncbi:MAG: hypothetical protein C0409_00120 [Novosphingobium sp.]|nr:hypothetical protein [Novosphingobium sp.]
MTVPLPRAELRQVLSHCPEIDSLRALAMIGVVAMHAKILPFGWTGVWLFFVISGYVVTLAIARHHDPRDPVRGAKHFMRQRVGRILPPYVFYLVVGLALSALLGIAQSPWAIISLFGFFHNITMAQGVGELEFWPAGHLWTVSIEMQFYLVYGLFAFFAPLAVTKRMLWCCIAIAPLARLVVSILYLDANPETAAYVVYSAPGLHFDSFAMGCLFALARLSVPLDKMLGPIVRLGATAMAMYVFSFTIINLLVQDRSGLEIVRDVVSGIMYGQGREVFIYTALGLVSLALLALTVARNPTVTRVTGLVILQWIGRLSYGGYIYHGLGLRLASFLISGTWDGSGLVLPFYRLAVFALALGLTMVMASLSWRFIEQPAAALVKRWGRGSTAPVATAVR